MSFNIENINRVLETETILWDQIYVRLISHGMQKSLPVFLTIRCVSGLAMKSILYLAGPHPQPDAAAFVFEG